MDIDNISTPTPVAPAAVDPAAITGSPPQDTAATGDPLWVTHMAARALSVPVGTPQAFMQLFDVPNGRARLGPVLLGRCSSAPRGYEPERGDLEAVSALAFDLNGVREAGEYVSPPFPTPARIRESLPFACVAYTVRHSLDDPRLTVVVPFARMHSLEEAHKVGAYICEKLWTSPWVAPMEVNQPVLPPQEVAPYLLDDGDGWHAYLPGPLADASAVPPDFAPALPYVPPGDTGAEKRRVRLEAGEAAARLVPTYMAMVERSEWWMWLGKHRALLPTFASVIASNIAPIVRPVRAAGLEAYRDACRMVRRKLAEAWLGRGDTLSPWEIALESAWESALKSAPTRPAGWEEFWKRGLPQEIGGITASPLGDLKRIVDQDGLRPDDWIFVAGTEKWHRRLATGEFDEQGITRGALTTLLKKHMHGGVKNANVDEFLASANHVYKRAAVFSTHAQVTKAGGVAAWNLYRPTQLKPRPGRTPNIDKLLLNLVGDDMPAEAVAFVKDWLAGMVQAIACGHPQKWLTYLIFQGAAGAGKDLLIRILKVILGPDNVVVADQARMKSNFVPIRPNTLLLAGNELRASSRDDEDMADAIKRITTDSTLMLEKKFADAGEVPNNLNFIILTNRKRAVKLDRDDRRANVFVPKKRLDSDVASAIVGDLEGARSEVAAFYDDLLQRKVAIRIDQLFQTKARSELIGMSQTRLEEFIELLKEVGVKSAWTEVEHARELEGLASTYQTRGKGEKLREYVSSEALLALARAHCPAQRGMELSHKVLAPAIAEAFPGASSAERVRLGGKGNAVHVWTGVPLAVEEGRVLRWSGDETQGSDTA